MFSAILKDSFLPKSTFFLSVKESVYSHISTASHLLVSWNFCAGNPYATRY
jgi:hypothetical protein